MFNGKDLEDVLQTIIRRWEIPGLAVGMLADGQIIYAKGFGVQSLETQTPVTLDSVFCVQSVSKSCVGTAVMQLVEQGKISLDAPLVQYLPYFQMDDERSSQITIRQALSHTSGRPDIPETDYVDWVTQHTETDAGAAERFVRSLSAKKLIAAPGERFSYSNIAYSVLGDLIAKVTLPSRKSSGASWGSPNPVVVLLPQRACPARCRILRAALTSRSMDKPHGHSIQRSSRERSGNTTPQEQQVLDV